MEELSKNHSQSISAHSLLKVNSTCNTWNDTMRNDVMQGRF